MFKNSFGINGQIQFADEHEFYRLLGFLAKSDHSTSIVWEHNEDQGAWGSEGRIQIYISSLPSGIGRLLLTAGNGGDVKSRVNCNEFIENICLNYGFVVGDVQNLMVIRQSIPVQYLQDFDDGLNL